VTLLLSAFKEVHCTSNHNYSRKYQPIDHYSIVSQRLHLCACFRIARNERTKRNGVEQQRAK
jgi:hypothetical protein